MRIENGEWVDLAWKEVITFEKKASSHASSH
jgi:branched-chain amino acid transport system substrate-binding protein